MEMSPSLKKYHAFISFRGEDTRTKFTSFLHSALSRTGISVYIDDLLEKGEDVWPALSKAIGESHVAVVVFSENYASSKWCLKELVKILQCRKRNGQLVIPVFYEVDPSDIRKQKGTYGEAFAKYEQDSLGDQGNEFLKEVSEWKAALTEAASISGRDSRSREYKNESQVIDKIVEDVLKKLELKFPDEIQVKDLVGFDKIRKDVRLLLSKKKSNQSLGNVQAIGIWGLPGIGKTTIAKALFSQLFPQYDGACFLENIREAPQKIGQSKLTSLREKLLSELLKDERLNYTTSFSMTRLSSKKVFVVLDDVGTPYQLDELCKGCSYVARGSKLIITTRDKHVLCGRIDENDIYEVKTWSNKESLELFCLSAFNERHPKETYENLSEMAVNYIGGIPLALKVLGSYLRGKSCKFWESELKKLKSYPFNEIQNVLKASYDGLEIPCQKIFLDIAFFFRGENKDFVERILNACDFFATSGMKVLEDKALITISSGKKIQMHDLVHDMGLNIVRRGIEDPGKRSRLRDIDEVFDVLQYRKKGSDAVEGIKLDLSQIDYLHLDANAFSMMTDIRFLKLYVPSGKRSGNVEYPGVLNKFSGQLRYLEWNGYRLKSLPETFFTKMLVEIHMPHSHITELWPGNGMKEVENLEGIDLSECKHLEHLPNLSNASKLKWVNLSGCESLTELHPSILSLDTLEILTLDGCEKLGSLKSKNSLKSLMNISVNGCTSLKEFSVSSDKMERLDLNNAGIEKLHSLIGDSSNLRWLNLENLRLQNLPSELSSLKSLGELRISNCRQLVLDKQMLHVLFGGLKYLRLLHLKDCCNLSELPDNIDILSNLYELRLDGSSVETLPASINHLSGLEILSLENCMNLKSLPELPIHIKELYAVNCTSLVTVSTLNTIATVMIGKRKYISFENCMKLDEASLDHIMKGAQLSAMNAIFQNVFVTRCNLEAHSFTYNFVKVCFPGSTVPENFTHRTAESPFTMNLPSGSKLLGLVMCAVLSPSDEIKKHGARIFCQFHRPGGTKVGYSTRWYHEPIRELNCDHVFLWYDAFHFDSIGGVRRYAQEVTVEFYVTNNLEECDVLNVRTKECGVHLIFASELPSLLRELDLDFKSKWQLGSHLALELQVELGSDLRLELESQHGASSLAVERSDETISNDMYNQEQDINQFCDCFIDDNPPANVRDDVDVLGIPQQAPSSDALTVVNDIFSLLSSEDAALISDFAASHADFALAATYPSLYKKIAYETFASCWRFLCGHSVLQLLTEHKDYVEEHIQTLRCFGFKGKWLDKMASNLQRSVPTSATVDFQKLCSDKAACHAQVMQLQQEITDLTNRLTEVEAELAFKIEELECLSAQEKEVEEARAVFDVPFSL